MNYVFEWFKNIVFVMGVHYVLIAASILALLYLFPKHKTIVLTGCFLFCLAWNFIFIAYFGFIMESGRGFDLDNCYHLLHVGGWIDYISYGSSIFHDRNNLSFVADNPDCRSSCAEFPIYFYTKEYSDFMRRMGNCRFVCLLLLYE